MRALLAGALVVGLGLVPARIQAAEPIGDRALEAGLEATVSDDIRLIDALVTFHGVEGQWRYSGTLSTGQIALDYVPAAVDQHSIFHRAGRLVENRLSGEIGLTNIASDRFEWTLSAGGYQGFTGYRSLWISHWYQLNFEGFPELEEPDPRGYYGSAALRWSYRPGTGVFQAQVTFARDTIAPAYDEVTDEFFNLLGIEALRSGLETFAWLLSTENVINGRLRTLLEYRLTHQSERELRHSVTARANFALSNRWFLQTRLGATFEAGGAEAEEDFNAFWIAHSLIWEVSERLTLDLGARAYRDNGEIENATGFSSAGPDLDSWSAQLGLRYFHGPHALRLAVGWIGSSYGPLDFENQFFEGLYQDRDFLTTTLSYRLNF
jgi:hypothetical protein